MISFTISADSGVNYQAEEGMTWNEWIVSEHNTDGYYLDGAIILFKKNGHSYKTTGVSSSDIIVSGKTYYMEDITPTGPV